jgi:hypothetical protein
MYAYIFIETAKMGIDVVGESQLIGYPTQYPSVSLMNYNTSEPNARFWVLKLLKDNFGPGDRLMETTEHNSDLAIQAFITEKGKKLLVINKRDKVQEVALPANIEATSVTFVAPSTGDSQPGSGQVQNNQLHLEPFEVAVVEVRQEKHL